MLEAGLQLLHDLKSKYYKNPLVDYLDTNSLRNKITKLNVSMWSVINRPLSFQHTKTCEIGLSDYHKLISTFFKCHHSRLNIKVILYRNYKNFNEASFLEDLKKWNLSISTGRSSPPEVFLCKGILKICNKFTGEHSCRKLISIKFLCSFIEIALRYWCSPVNLLHIFRIRFHKNTSGGLLLHRHPQQQLLLPFGNIL